ncbi:MBL fold metallo-hydrolase [Pedobacter frigoris]|uniref:MBL fold metallo-hydrolase n=1 Tax=Pedobacter frigoris TaxID=2571272 RepID=A0A4U1CK25_9SPHI|nr:MBL fold metallo-hydrolase [Pedobacter frigoris]TKC07182.1 hypothetical protein FA047_07955 [Pedobacter frigoris]
MIEISYINHASVLISIDNIKLLVDPWFTGFCFDEGWGLRYHNTLDIELATMATHLWISHFHSDHYHLRTLKRILNANPEIILIANQSFNFSFDQVGRKIGFKNIICFHERKKMKITDHISLVRYPTTGIDNMLLIESDYGNILNYNDCNLSGWAQKQLAKKIGPVDIFMSNFNHAGKLLVSPPINHLDIKNKLKKNFVDNFKNFNPHYVFPFASYHYYRAMESLDQNESMLDVTDLIPLQSNILNVKVGDTVKYSKSAVEIISETGYVKKNEIDSLKRKTSVNLDILLPYAEKYLINLRKNFGLFVYTLPDLFIKVTDLDIIVKFSASKGLRKINHGKHHIEAHSTALANWFNDVYGTDSFVVGAHFKISSNNKIPLKWQIIFGILIDNKLSIKHLFSMLFSRKGLEFLLNRREEIVGILLERKLSADYHD